MGHTMIRRCATYAAVIVGAWLAGAEAVIWRLRRWEQKKSGRR